MILRHFNENNANKWDYSSLRVRDDTGDWDLYDTFCGQAPEKNQARYYAEFQSILIKMFVKS